jgi:ketosteroid isomerase-like protein
MTELLDQDVDKIKEVHNRWMELELSGENSKLVDLCTEDIQWLVPNASPIAGKEAIANYLDTNRVDVKEIDLTNLSIHGSGSLAYLTSDYRTRFLTPGHSEMHEARGTHLWVLRKSDRHVWRVAAVAWSSW